MHPFLFFPLLLKTDNIQFAFGGNMAEATRRYCLGWQQAMELGLVPDALTDGIDAAAALKDAQLLQRSLEKRRRANKLAKEHAEMAKDQRVQARAEIMAKYKQQREAAAEEYKQAIEHARQRRDAQRAGADAHKADALAALERKAAAASKHACMPKAAGKQADVMTLISRCRSHNPRLRGLTLAAFPGRANQALRHAIANADVCTLQRFAAKRA